MEKMVINAFMIFDAAFLMYKQGMFQGADSLLTETYENGYKSLEAYFLHGFIFTKIGSHENANKFFEKGLNLDCHQSTIGSHPGIDNLIGKIGDLQFDKASQIFDEIVTIVNPADQVHYVVARFLQNRGDIGPAIRNLEVAVELNPSFFDAKRELAFLLLQTANHKVSQITRSVIMFRELYSQFPNDPEVCFGLGISIDHQGQSQEAELYFKRAFDLNPGDIKYISFYSDCLMTNGNYQELLIAINRVLEFLPQNSYLLELKRRSEKWLKRKDKPKSASWPQKLSELENLESAIEKFIFNITVDPIFLFRKTDKIITLGSCFAENVARALRENDVDAYNITFGEMINSTYANLEYLRRVSGHEMNRNSERVKEILHRDPIGDRKKFEEGDGVIFTLGVAPCFFDIDDGSFIIFQEHEFSFRQLDKKYIWRNTNVEENKSNIAEIVKTLKSINPRLKVIFTVSPIPLSITFDYESVFMADCVSKSTMRAAIDEFVREEPSQTMYWPTFEVFRWLGAYTGPVYGADDGSTAHASEFVVNTIFKEFYDKCCIK